jgi:hypothetical protein
MSKKTLIRLPLKVDDNDPIGREVVLAKATNVPHVYELNSIPAFLFGVALHDTVELLDVDSGAFNVVKRGGQVTIRLYLKGTLDRIDVRSLLDEITAANGYFEVGKNAKGDNGTSLLLLSLPINLGFPRIEALMVPFHDETFQWEYGNVYDRQGHSLNWWE